MMAGNRAFPIGIAGWLALLLAVVPCHAATLPMADDIYGIPLSESHGGDGAVEAGAGDEAGDEAGDDAVAERVITDAFGSIAPSRTPIASFGPFHMVAPDRAELIGSIESDTPAQFAALLRAFPGLRQIDMVECPGTGDDSANLALARMVRHHGVMTNVPDGGSVRSGGVELFLAGAQRRAAPTAEFAVHSWRDEDGYEADDFAANDPVHLEYLGFYREMGMSEANARAFYALTNSAPHDDALYLGTQDIARFVTLN